MDTVLLGALGGNDGQSFHYSRPPMHLDDLDARLASLQSHAIEPST